MRFFRKNCEKGTVTTETAIVSGLFFFCILGFFEVFRLGYSVYALEHGLREGARYASLNSKKAGLSREQSIIDVIKSNSLTKLQAQEISICPASLSNCSKPNAGNPGEVIRLELLVNVESAFNFSIPVRRSKVIRNEPQA